MTEGRLALPRLATALLLALALAPAAHGDEDAEKDAGEATAEPRKSADEKMGGEPKKGADEKKGGGAERADGRAAYPPGLIPLGLEPPPPLRPPDAKAQRADGELSLRIGRAALDAGAAVAALPSLRRAEKRLPKDARPKLWLGVALARDGRRLDLAEKALREAAALDSKSAEIARRLALVLEQEGLYPEALARYALAAKLGPKRADVREAWGRAARLAGNEGQAREAFEALLALDSTSTIALTNLAELYERAGDHGRAETMHRSLVHQAPKDWLHWERFARFLVRRGRPADAETALVEVRKLNPKRELPDKEYRPLR